MNKYTTVEMNCFEDSLFGSIRALVETVDVKAHNKAIELEIREIQKCIMYEADWELVGKAMNRLITLKADAENRGRTARVVCGKGCLQSPGL